MEVKPAGPERDREIAEIKYPDMEYVEQNHRGVMMGFMRDPNIKKGYGYGNPRHKVKPYSTSIAHAMELWEEMKGAVKESSIGQLSLELNTTSFLINCQIIETHINKPTKHVNHKGNTEADAISGAWLKWRADERA